MNRRELLGSLPVGASAFLAGCLEGSNPNGTSSEPESTTNRSDDSNSDRDPNSSENSSESDGSTEPPSGDCGLGDASLSELLTTEPGDGVACFDGATPDLVVENDREDAVAVTVAVRSESDSDADADDIDSDSDSTVDFEETYDLEPSERVRESSPFEAASDLTVTVTTDDESLEGAWDARSCRRHGVAITDDGLEVGWLEPLQGPADTQHDCYPGDDLRLEIGTLEEPRTATVTVVDRCAGTRFEETYDLSPDVRERIEGELVSGGLYDVTVDVDGGETETYEFHEGCWGVTATIEDDGGVRIHQFEVD